MDTYKFGYYSYNNEDNVLEYTTTTINRVQVVDIIEGWLELYDTDLSFNINDRHFSIDANSNRTTVTINGAVIEKSPKVSIMSFIFLYADWSVNI